MPEQNQLCVLVAITRADDSLAAHLGRKEAEHIAERCLNRAERALAAFSGKLIGREEFTVIAGFERCDAAVLAANEMLNRIRSLPAISGLKQPIRIGIHSAAAGALSAQEGNLYGARQLANCAEAEQALASAPTIDGLGPSARHVVAERALISPLLENLPWPVFPIAERVNKSFTLPPASILSQRLRLQHRGRTLFVEEARPVLLLGRELANDFAIENRRASRQHARIERRREGFVLVDVSTNGCHILIDGEGERRIHQRELLLYGSGNIACGFTASEDPADLVRFDLI